MKLFEYRATLAFHLVVAAEDKQTADKQLEQFDGYGHRWTEVGDYFEVVEKELFDARDPDPKSDLEDEADIICEPQEPNP